MKKTGHGKQERSQKNYQTDENKEMGKERDRKEKTKGKQKKKGGKGKALPFIELATCALERRRAAR